MWIIGWHDRGSPISSQEDIAMLIACGKMKSQTNPKVVIQNLVRAWVSSLVLLTFSELRAHGATPSSLVPAIITKTPQLPSEKAGYYYSVSHKPVSYVSDAVTMIRFNPINLDLLPTLVLDVPDGIEILGGLRKLKIVSPQRVMRDGMVYRRYRIVPDSPAASKFTFFWRSSLPAGTHHTAYYYAEWLNGQQDEQKLAINVISLPQGRLFKKIPVWYSIPSDMADIWSSPADYRRGGFNTLDIWAYLSPEERQWGTKILERVIDQYSDADIDVWAWPGDWWWKKARQSDGRSITIDGQTADELNLLYRGKHFKHWLDAGKRLIDRGLYTHVVDPEIYRHVDFNVGYSKAARADFQQYLINTGTKLVEKDPAIFMRRQRRYPHAVKVWRKWRAKKYTDFFVDYRTVMEAYMKRLGINQPFKFIIYSTYHFQWNSFYAYDDYEIAPPYLNTLEDPIDLSNRAFDVIAPMIYPDLYPANGNRKQYDLALPWKDTYSLHQLVGKKSSIMPLLSTGYPYTYYERDLSAEMLKYNIFEAIAGGAKGFGFWGEGIQDALDMAVVGNLVDRLVPAELIILNGSPFVAKPVSGVASVKGVIAPEGALILVSEYSDNPYDVTVESPVAGTVVDIETGDTIAELHKANQSFTISLVDRRARMFHVSIIDKK